MIKQAQLVIRISIFLLLALLSSACSITGVFKSPDSAITWDVPVMLEVPESLQDRVLMFWTHNYRREWDKSYKMETPEVQDGMSSELYHAYYNGGWKNLGVSVTNVELGGSDQTTAKVFVSITYQRPGAANRTKTVSLSNDWKKVEGKWYHVFHDPIIKLRKGSGKQ